MRLEHKGYRDTEIISGNTRIKTAPSRLELAKQKRKSEIAKTELARKKQIRVNNTKAENKKISDRNKLIAVSVCIVMVLAIVLPKVGIAGQANILKDKINKTNSRINAVQNINAKLESQYIKNTSYTIVYGKAVNIGMVEKRKSEVICPEEFRK